VKINPPLFFDIRKDGSLWQQVPEWFKDEIRVALTEVDDKAFLELAREVLSELPNTRITKTELFLSSLVRHSIKQDITFSRLGKALDKGESEKVALLGFGTLRILNRVRIGFLRGPVTPVTIYEWFTILLTKGNLAIRSSALPYLCFIADKLESTYLLVRLVRLAISREKHLSDAMVQNLHILILNKGESIKSLSSRTVDCLRQDLLGSLKHTARLDYWAESLVEFASQEIGTLAGFVESRILISLETNASEYQAIPFRGLPFLGRMVKSFDDYERLVTRIGSWYRRGSIWRYHLKVLMEGLCETAEVKPYAQKYVEKQLEKEDIGAALLGCSFLPLDAETLNAFNKAGAHAISCGKTEEIESLLHGKTLPHGGWQSLAGEPSPELVERKNLFQQMRKETNPGELNAIIDDCIATVDSIVEMGLRADEEIMNPRS
jgi:hypothetical protein